MARGPQNIEPLAIDDFTEEDVENYKEFVSSALENAGVKVSSKPLFLDSHQKALEEDKAWSDAVSYENGGELCISCWNPEENTLSWNSGMFRLFGYPLPEDASEEGNDSYTLYRGGDLTCTTNRLPSSTRNHFYKAANESVRMGSEFECLHELYSYGQDGQLGSQFVLNHAKQQGKIWIGVIQVISTDLLRCLRDNAAMNSVVSSFVLNTSQNMMNVIQMEVGRFFELTQMNALCGVVNGLDLDDYELDDDDDDDDDNQDSLMLANDSTDDGSWIDGFQRLDYLDSFYLNHIRKVYASSFPQAINAVLKVAQKRSNSVVYMLEKNPGFTIRIPVLCYQRALLILLERVGSALAAENIVCHIEFGLMEYEEGNKWQFQQPIYQEQHNPKHILRTQVSFHLDDQRKIFRRFANRQKFVKLVEILGGKFALEDGLMLLDIPVL